MKTTEEREKDPKTGHLILPRTFRANQFDFIQEIRVGQFAVYSKKKSHWSHSTYETIKILRHDGYELAGNAIPPSEVFPGSEQWGLWGFSFTNLKDAKNKLDELIKNGKNKQ